jgi:beta-galactosidase
MKSVLLFLILSTLVASAQRSSLPLNESWQFHLGDVPAASTDDFDASDWDSVDVPHDWSFENGVSRKGAQSDKGGYYSGGIGWYRKSFTLAALRADQRVCIDFDGVYMNSEVWVNGQKLGKRPYGYISFSYDITASVKPGVNVIAVRCDNSREPSARWYHPCGIYAPVQLTLTHQSHILKDGIQITTPLITRSQAEVQIQTSTSDDRHTELQHIILDPSGKEVARTTGNQAIVHHPKRCIPSSLGSPKTARSWMKSGLALVSARSSGRLKPASG